MAFPSPAKDYAEGRISLDKELIQHPGATYFFRMENDSMLQAFIPPGALLVVDYAETPKDRSIVLAAVNGEFIIRYLRQNGERAWLAAANPRIPEIRMDGVMDITIVGVVIGVLIQHEKLPAHVRAC
ncbi:MAG TPA: translesion error-prone DNA polymerase V autoproteolytic subunit [Chitinophagaceae bacterium]|nr:translesion error-prone DNA polymerase V autoproteolytic subunit [Chitinophagaceae bacterium]